MKSRNNPYKRHRFPPEIIQYAVWLCFRFNLSHRDIEELLAERGIFVTRESVRLWCNKFGPHYARRLRQKHRGFGDTFFIDEVFVKIEGKQHYLWRAVDQDGEVIDVFLQSRRDGAAANGVVYSASRPASRSNFLTRMPSSPQQLAAQVLTAFIPSASSSSQAEIGWFSVAQSQEMSVCA